MPEGQVPKSARLDPRKFRDPELTASGERRAEVALAGLSTLWFNTGSLCNIECVGCYMDSSPRNDALVYLSATEVGRFLDEAAENDLPLEEVGFTGGEPFMNRELPAMLDDTLGRGLRALVLSNAMKPMWNKRAHVARLAERYGARFGIRVSVDHHTPEHHEELRGERTWAPMLQGLRWLAAQPLTLTVAGRTLWNEDESSARAGYAEMFRREGIAVDAADPAALVLFPEMDAERDVPEITERCWGILGVSPDAMMCASSRMVVKRRGGTAPVVVPCTLLPYDAAFDMGRTLKEAAGAVKLNHPHCARFCVLGGASCSPA